MIPQTASPCGDFTVCPTLLALWLALSGLAARKAAHRRRPAFRRPLLEALEDRTVPSTLTVLTTLDSGAGSLRAVITAAKSGDAIVFAPSLDGQTITLTSDQLTINKTLDIEGPGASLLAISGSDTNRVFAIEGGAVTIAGLTITHGQANVYGGGVLNHANLTLTNDVFADNTAMPGGGSNTIEGGAVNNGANSTLTVSNCMFIGNQVFAGPSGLVQGGALWNHEGSTATIIDSTFTANRAHGGNGTASLTNGRGGPSVDGAEGGAIHNDGHLTITDSTFTDNQAIGGNGFDAASDSGIVAAGIGVGGAVFNHPSATAVLVISGSTFSDNEAIGGSDNTGSSRGHGFIADGAGGAVQNLGVATITNSTFNHNLAMGGSNNMGGSTGFDVGNAQGGALSNKAFSAGITLTVNNCHFTNNQAIGGSGNTSGLFVGEAVGGGLESELGAAATITNSIFTGNLAREADGGAGANGGDALGGGIANLTGSPMTVSGCTFTDNQAVGGAGGAGANGGNGFGGGLFNDGPSIWPVNAGTPAALTVTGGTVSGNQATGGAAGSGGSAGQGVGGGAYFATGGAVCLDAFTVANLLGNTASTSNNDVFGSFTIC
jgi:hypothetical protein